MAVRKVHDGPIRSISLFIAGWSAEPADLLAPAHRRRARDRRETRTRPPAHARRRNRGREKAMTGWYRQRALAWLPRRISPWAQRMSQHPCELDVRDLGYRWGSLGKNDRLNVHWAAMQLPVSLLDYVIVHELATSASPATPPPSGPPCSGHSRTTTSAAPASPPPASPSGSAKTARTAVA